MIPSQIWRKTNGCDGLQIRGADKPFRKDLIAGHDQLVEHVETDVNHYLEKLRHGRMVRLVDEQSRIAAKMERITKLIAVMTFVVTVATIFTAVVTFFR